MLKDGATKEQFVEVLKNAKSLLKSTRSTNAADALDEFVIRNKRAVKNRISWGYPRLDSFTKGIGGGMWIGLLAEAGAGKTTFIYNATNNMTNAGINVGICSLEEQTVMEVTPKLTAMHIGRNPGGGDFYPEEVEAAKPVIKKVQLYEGDETRDDVIEWIKECYYAHDVRVIFIDYLQLLFADEKNTEQVKKDCYAFKRLVRKECPDLCIVGIIQPKQKQKLLTREGVVSNDKLDGSDARSGSAINQSVDAMLIIQPVKGHPNLTQLEFTKVRGHLRVSKKDWMGLFTQLEYDHATLRQIEVSNLTYGG
jgi:replicative DNA helicase